MSSPATAHIKFEPSPVESLADSFVSTPGTLYPPLFDDANDLDLMDHEQDHHRDAMTPCSFDNDSAAGTPAPEKKPVKKRKSWGQQLPEPKTNLPPRKRAKTEDEKEQRRVERVLRNRRAAQSSRERKRQEVEALEAKMMEKEMVNADIERRYRDLERQLADAQQRNFELQQQLELATGGNVTVFRGTSPAHTEQFRAAPSPVTFSQELFSSRDAPERASFTAAHPVVASPLQTVNPASLSPEIRPVAEPSHAGASDLTQYPAVSVGSTSAVDRAGERAAAGDYGFASHFDSSLFDAPVAAASDHDLYTNTIAPIFDTFDLNYDHLVDHHDSAINDFDFNDFLHHDETNQPAPEAQSSDSLAEYDSSLQPHLGASLTGCDDGGHAVMV